MAGDYYYSQVSAGALVGGTEIPIADLTVTYALNSVPTCTIKAAVGWDEYNAPAATVDALNAAGYMTPLEVVVRDEGDSPFGSGEKKVFEGFVAGPRNDATAKQSVGAVVDGVGILNELQLGNKLSWLFHNTSPGNLFEPCVKDTGSHGGTNGPYLDGSQSIPVSNVAQDMWGNGILPVFKILAEKGDRLALGMEGPPNTRAIAALQKITTNPNCPLRVIQRAAGASQYLEKGLAVQIANISSGTSFWDTLVSLCSTWSLAIVPRVEIAYLVPFIEAAQHYYTTITLDHMFSVAANDFTERANCRGVVLVGQAQNIYSAESDSAANPGAGFLGKADGFQLGIAEANGQFKAYEWPSCYGAAVIQGASQKNIPRAKTNFPTLKKPEAQRPESSVAKTKEAELGSFMDQVAEARFRRDLVAARMCNVVGPLRFDICPGTQVRLEMIGGGDSASYMYGVVTQVDIRINAEQPYASTTFAVSHLRTEAQQASAAVSSTHPVFGRIFVGDTL